MTVPHNPKAAGDQGRTAYRRTQARTSYCRTTEQLGNLGLDTAVPEGVRALAVKSGYECFYRTVPENELE